MLIEKYQLQKEKLDIIFSTEDIYELYLTLFLPNFDLKLLVMDLVTKVS